MAKSRKALSNGGFMEANTVDINDWTNKIIYDKHFCKSEYKKYVENNYSIDNVSGFVTSNILHKFITKAKRKKIYRVFLSDILSYTNADSITDRNLRLLLKFPSKYKKTYLSCIGHSTLSFYQMQILNKHSLSLEAFSWLFDNICHYSFFSNEDMLQILRENSDIRSIAIDNCIDMAKNKYGSSSKLDIAKEWSNKLKIKEKNKH